MVDGFPVEFVCAPILLIGFNRPERLAAQVERLRQVKPKRLFIAVDGPRKDRPEDVDAILRTREAAKLVDWPCELSTRFLNDNHGCRFAPPEAISWMFESVDAGIILEDDCVPTMDFLRYATELLVRYRDESCVGMISGNNFYGFQSDKTVSYHFSRHVHIWGWATWKRSWSLYDGTLKKYQKTVEEIVQNPHPDKFERYWRKYLLQVLENPTTWDIQWCIALRANGLVSAVPQQNIVSNIGHEVGALHTAGFVYDLPHFLHVGTVDFPLKHPDNVLCDVLADHRHAKRSAGYLPRALTLIGAHFNGAPVMVCMKFFRVVERIVPFLFNI